MAPAMDPTSRISCVGMMTIMQSLLAKQGESSCLTNNTPDLTNTQRKWLHSFVSHFMYLLRSSQLSICDPGIPAAPGHWRAVDCVPIPT